jgi:hypothetical protein
MPGEGALSGEDVLWASIGADVPRGQVSLDLGYSTPQAEEVLQEFRGEPLCVEGLPQEERVPQGPQPTAGEAGGCSART